MPWQRTVGGSGGLNSPRVTLNGSCEIHGGLLHQEDKVVKLWEVAKVNATDSIFDGIHMWWSTLTEVKAEEFNTINFFEDGLSTMQVGWCKTLIYVPDRSLSKFWEVAKINAKSSIFDGIQM